MRKKVEPEVFVGGRCAVASETFKCGKPWKVWCRGCNLVYCKPHSKREAHACESRDKRSQATASRFYPFKGGLALERGGNRITRPAPKEPEANSSDTLIHQPGQNGKHK